jgi:SAM-dependent methyltransferase
MADERDVSEPACLVCSGAMRHRFAAVERGFDVFACEVCGSGRTWPALDAGAIGAWYPQAYYGTRNVRFNRLFERLTRWFRHRRAAAIRRLIPAGKVLDVGCGRGVTLSFLRAHGFETVGLELSDAAAAHARDVLGLDVRTGDFLDADFEPESFAAIIFWHSLEHLAEPMRALDRARELLAPGGILIVAVPNFASIQARVSGPSWFHLDVPRHYVHFTARALKKSMKSRGFAIIDVAHFSLEQNPYGWIQSLLNRVFEHDLLYSILKEPAARRHQLRSFPLQTIATSIAGALLLPVAMALMMVETMLRRGGTVEVYGRKESK